ncbi:hypothetical protein D3C77_336660 [compost metagenome]
MQLLGEQAAGDHHARSGDRGNGVDANVLARAFDGQRVGKTDQAGLGRGVVALAEVAENAGAGGGHDDAAVALLTHDRPHGVGQAEGTLDVNVLDQVPLRFGHLVERTVAQDPGVVDQDVDGAEHLERGGDDFLAFGHRVVVGDSFTPQGADFRDHGIGRGTGGTQAFGADTQVIDHDLGTPGTQQQGVGASQAVAGAGDNGNFAVKANFLRHVCSPMIALTTCER